MAQPTRRVSPSFCLAGPSGRAGCTYSVPLCDHGLHAGSGPGAVRSPGGVAVNNMGETLPTMAVTLRLYLPAGCTGFGLSWVVQAKVNSPSRPCLSRALCHRL